MRATTLTLMCSALLGILCANAFAATVYKWVDENGVVHYSDQPHAGSDKIEVGGVQTYSAPRDAASRSSAQRPSPQSAGSQSPYQLCGFTRPENDEVFLNTDSVSGTVQLSPALQEGHRVVITYDGKRMPNLAPQGGGFTISPAERGTHTLSAVVENETGTVVCASRTVMFHVRQPSKQAPVRAVRPRF